MGPETLELRAEEADVVNPNLQSPGVHGSTFAPPYIDHSGATASANPTPARDFLMNSMGRRTSVHPEFNMPSGIHSSHVSGLHPEDEGNAHEFGARKSSYFGQFFESKRTSKASQRKKKQKLKALLQEKARLKEQTM